MMPKLIDEARVILEPSSDYALATEHAFMIVNLVLEAAARKIEAIEENDRSATWMAAAIRDLMHD